MLSGNPYLVTALDSCLTLLARSRWLVTREAHVRQEAQESHRELMKALRDRDTDAAVATIQRHLRSTHESVIVALNAYAKGYRVRGIDIAVTADEHG